MRELTYSQPRPREQKRKLGVTAKYRAKRRRAEDPVKTRVRAQCVERDGYCRYFIDMFNSDEWMDASGCDGLSEWAHLEKQKRAHTRGMKPEQRHTTAGTAMLCRKHHQAYDAGQLGVEARTDRGADGLLAWSTR